MVRRTLTIFLAVVCVSAIAPLAHADAYLRVISQRAPVHSGPSGRYREIFVAERGDVFQVLERGTQGYWFRVELEDGTPGWIFGELVFPFEVVEADDPGFFVGVGRRIRRALLGPSPVALSTVELSFSAGLLDGEGTFLFRPGWVIDKYFAFETFFGLSPRRDDDLFLAGGGWTLRLMPGAAVGPFLNAGLGVAHLRPKVDNFTQENETLFALSAGGGLEITFKKQITLRLDFRNWTIYDPDQASNAQEYTGGLAIFF